MKTRIAINGFGRIGRTVFRLLLNHPYIEVVAINDLADAKTLAHLLKYDSVHGVLQATVNSNDSALYVDGKTFPVLNEKHIEKLPWRSFDVDIVIEATGKHKTTVPFYSITFTTEPKKSFFPSRRKTTI